MSKKFQIIIPMSGFGERFRRAGYKVPKPLIEVDGKPIIAHVIEMFPNEEDFIFICNNDHLLDEAYSMRQIILEYCPTAQIIGIDSHKLGPVYAVSKIFDRISKDRPVVVNYCDFSCYWNWDEFKSFVNTSESEGCIPAYKGFHPHSLGTTNYAYMLENDGWVEDIQEKQPYTNDRMNEFASSGTYYFKSGRLMIDAFNSIMEQKLSINSEFYVSLAYKFLFMKSLKVSIFPLQHFMQWGTPEDLQEYQRWSNIFKKYVETQDVSPLNDGSTVIPMAGLGSRFKSEGYELTKPLIPISGKPMVIQAVNDLPKTSSYIFAVRKDMEGFKEISNTILNTYKSSHIVEINKLTDGQACTTEIAIDKLLNIKSINHEPITISACDNGVLFDSNKYASLIDNENVDIVVWGVRGHSNAIRYPEMYGWIDSDADHIIKKISVKKPLKYPDKDPIVIGTFTFKKIENFFSSLEKLYLREGKINGEYFLDSVINDAIEQGLKCKLFEVDYYISWGTPNELKTFEYWQSCFHKWKSHPYSLYDDKRVTFDDALLLEKKYRKFDTNYASK